MKFGTKLLHTGFEIDEHTGATSIPIHQASTFQQNSIEEKERYFYSRVTNPTREALENTTASLENGRFGFAYASGMAAISSVISIFEKGDHIIACSDIYGGAYRAFTNLFPRLGISISFVDTTNLEAIENAVQQSTKAIYTETPSNPIMRISDVNQISDIAQKHSLITIVDNTFMTPYLQNPLDLGADVVVHSATKFLGGHSDVLAGLVVTDDEGLAANIREVQTSFGAVLGPHDSWLVMRGIKTLKIRMDQQEKNARQIASWLAQQEKIPDVYFPGLPEHTGHELQKAQSRGFGCVVAFTTASREETDKLVKNLELPILGASLGGVETILSHPFSMSHAAIPEEKRVGLGITENLLRLSVGIEEADDLIEDLNYAVNKK